MNKRTRNTPPTPIKATDAAARQMVGQPNKPDLLVQEQSVTVRVQLPPPEMLRHYDEVRPGTADLLIRWNEEEQAHRRRVDVMALDANMQAQARQLALAERQVDAQRESMMYQAATVRDSDRRGQHLGAALCAFAIGGAIYLALNGQPWVAGVLAAVPTAAIIQSFRTLTRQDARESARPPAP